MLDVAAATAAYIDRLGAEKLARAAAYTHGAHWITLWDTCVAVLVAWLIVRSGLLHRIGGIVGHRRKNLAAFLVATAFLVCADLITLPWTVYSGWWREKAYDRTSQPLGDFLGQHFLSLLLTALGGALVLTGVYWLVRRSGRRWWLWSTGLVAAAMAVFLLLLPTFIEPLFNKYDPVPPGPVRDALVVMGKRAGVPADRLFVYDGSRQSNNFTANAGGIGSTARIAISDVAFKGASLDEVRAVTGHEIGHYVLHHTWWSLLSTSVLALLTFYLIDRLYSVAAGLLGERSTLQEPAGLPVLVALFVVLSFVTAPIDRTVSRKLETDADRYSLTTENLPDAMAAALVKTADYRYPRPGALEEFLFYDHPSVERRVRMCMQWKATHPPTSGSSG